MPKNLHDCVQKPSYSHRTDCSKNPHSSSKPSFFLKWKQKRLWVDTRKEVPQFTLRTVKPWKRLPREAGGISTLAVFEGPNGLSPKPPLSLNSAVILCWGGDWTNHLPRLLPTCRVCDPAKYYDFHSSFYRDSMRSSKKSVMTSVSASDGCYVID